MLGQVLTNPELEGPRLLETGNSLWIRKLGRSQAPTRALMEPSADRLTAGVHRVPDGLEH